MKDIKIKASFINSDKIIEFKLSDIIYLMGSICAEDVPIEEEIGEDFAYLKSNWDDVILELQ